MYVSQYSCLENPMDGGARQGTVHGIAKGQTPLRRRQWHPTPVLLPGKSHGQKSLVGCSPWGRWGSDTTEWLHFHSSLSCIGKGNGNPLQCSCLENPRDGASLVGCRLWGRTESRLKRLSSSRHHCIFYVLLPSEFYLVHFGYFLLIYVPIHCLFNCI